MASNNLLYNGYKPGHAIYVNTGTNELAEFNCAESADCAMYFADLEPNTTYTLSNVDNSDRFRWGLTSIDIKNLSNTATTEQPATIWTQGFVSEGSYVVEPITFTTGEDDIHLGVYYTNNGAYDRRVMLNKGDTILPYEEPDLNIDDTYDDKEVITSIQNWISHIRGEIELFKRNNVGEYLDMNDSVISDPHKNLDKLVERESLLKTDIELLIERNKMYWGGDLDF
jgi:hypothetical protein